MQRGWRPVRMGRLGRAACDLLEDERIRQRAPSNGLAGKNGRANQIQFSFSPFFFSFFFFFHLLFRRNVPAPRLGKYMGEVRVHALVHLLEQYYAPLALGAGDCLEERLDQ